MPTNSAVREMLPPNRLTCAVRYSRSKISRASRSGSDMRCSPPALPGVAVLVVIGAVVLAPAVAKRIEDEMQYPGEIKVTLIREVRSVEYAR